MPDRVFQEFYCNKSGEGCGGYFTVKLNVAINGVVKMVCPKCQHKHQRTIKDGKILVAGRYGKETTDEIHTTMAAWSKKPKTVAMQDSYDPRDGAIIKSDADIIAQHTLKNSLRERFGLGANK
tara:strand:- start:1018 stop:1386 length:369 start_codon:yes stop_codon:yes gene_type:complete